jgi:hypothetical protein
MVKRKKIRLWPTLVSLWHQLGDCVSTTGSSTCWLSNPSTPCQ